MKHIFRYSTKLWIATGLITIMLMIIYTSGFDTSVPTRILSFLSSGIFILSLAIDFGKDFKEIEK